MNYIEKLEKLLDNSYTPYSNYPVSAIVVMKDGKEYNGVNVENSSYGQTMCAERNAIYSAITDGYKKGDFKEIYLMTIKRAGMPCGACRQVMQELFDKETNVLIAQENNQFKKITVDELLPHPFDEGDLI